MQCFEVTEIVREQQEHVGEEHCIAPYRQKFPNSAVRLRQVCMLRIVSPSYFWRQTLFFSFLRGITYFTAQAAQ